ncbi:Molybdopterin-guanine dinucleotide biosynthesis protein A (MobA) (PDB:1E5K) (PUBMED:32239579) [Commensalibacter communis]|uniref:nucleotidyltransferase family protein n=1 Tax=Commensalibacter communis TaxID=2972786 RepID=UPI0022FFB74D|nr:nucleotidyltransferase family protein [Commensalibacter communis]CAI3949089.1 Molybdopterin-guanine dinucleotide biosynthesis protein A (MobA) (PDB:1E5K) (PUBMED:32239579) [Commensalibacter communis]
MERETVNALILAGSREGQQDPLAKQAHVSHKAILPILGRPMIEYVVQALSKLSNINKIAVTIEQRSIVQDILPEYIQYLPAALGPSDSVIQAIETLGTPLLVTTADNPLLQPEWISHFLKEAELTKCDIAVGIALREQIETDVPNTRRTYIKLADGSFSGCNLFLFRTPQSIQVAKLWQKLEKHRKRPVKMSYLLGYKIILRYLIKCLTRNALKKRIYKLTKAKTHFVVMPWGQASVDVDKPEDLKIVRTLMQN